MKIIMTQLSVENIKRLNEAKKKGLTKQYVINKALEEYFKKAREEK